MFGGEKSLTERIKEVFTGHASIPKDKDRDEAMRHPADISTMDRDIHSADMHPADSHSFDQAAEDMRKADQMMRDKVESDFAAMHRMREKAADEFVAPPKQELSFMDRAMLFPMHAAAADLALPRRAEVGSTDKNLKSSWDKSKEAVSDKATAAKSVIAEKATAAKDVFHEKNVDRGEVMGKEKYASAAPVVRDDADKENMFGPTMSKAKDYDKENRGFASSMNQFEGDKFKHAVPVGKDEAEKEARDTGKMIDQTKGGIAEKVGHNKKSI